MKKCFLSIVTLFYMLLSSGIAMDIHHCMGKKAGVDFYKTENGKCSRCGMKEKKGGCCNDEHKFYKLEDAHKNVSNYYDATLWITVITNDFISVTNTLFISYKTGTYYKEPPQISSGPPVYLKNCVFRI